MNDLLNSIRTKTMIDKFDLKFNKALGQNFLIDNDILDKIVASANLTKDDKVLEIGPGIGLLTVRLADSSGKVLSIELDDKLIPILNDNLKEFDNVVIYHGDAMKVDLMQLTDEHLKEPFTICANIPYYITTPLINRFFKEDLNVKNIVLMIQKEVAERMVAKPGGKDYGALSLLIQYYSKPSIVTLVPPNCFVPRPKIDSAVIKLEMYKKPPVELISSELFFNVIKASFSQRRKTLSNALKPMGIPREELKLCFDQCSIDPSRRGETLSIDEFANLSNSIYRLKK
jgi:16S rRNA (adenine1518-N6/adenine1519-N6)-dimethyltransferase